MSRREQRKTNGKSLVDDSVEHEPAKKPTRRPKEELDHVDPPAEKEVLPREEPVSHGVTDSPTDNFVYFIRQADGKRSDEIVMKVGYTDDVPAYKTSIETNWPVSLNCHKIIQCTRGDAKNIYNQFVAENSKNLRKNSWFLVGKSSVDKFCSKVCEDPAYGIVTEAKAKPTKSKTRSRTKPKLTE